MAAAYKAGSLRSLAAAARVRSGGSAPRPSFSRGSIEWRDRGPLVTIWVELSNEGDRPTEPECLVIETGPLGAFAPWRPLAFVPVDSMAPGERRLVSTRVARVVLPTLPALPEFSLPEFSLPEFSGARALQGGGSGWLPPSDRIDASSSEWAGNLNVWFETAPESAVEVHRALHLRVRATTAAAVGVYVPRDLEGFEMRVECLGAGWAAEVRFLHETMALLRVRAPVAGRRAAVNLIVTRRSDGRSVPVEFAFESIEGPTEGIGCERR